MENTDDRIKREREHVIYVVKKSFSITTPWKKHTMNESYDNGWNDCLKELKKKQKDLIKWIENL